MRRRKTILRNSREPTLAWEKCLIAKASWRKREQSSPLQPICFPITTKPTTSCIGCSCKWARMKKLSACTSSTSKSRSACDQARVSPNDHPHAKAPTVVRLACEPGRQLACLRPDLGPRRIDHALHKHHCANRTRLQND